MKWSIKMSKQLSWEIVSDIRYDYENKHMSQKELCEKYDVKSGAMSKIITYKSWTENSTKKILYEAFGEKKELSEWVKDSRSLVDRPTLNFRIYKKQIPLEIALTTPPDSGVRWVQGEDGFTQSEYNREGEKSKWDSD
jgi:hypothetical protein